VTETENLILSAQKGDESAFEKLILNNSALVWSIVKRFLGRSGVDADDLYQLGCLGLVKAVKGFDISLGNQFSTYAVPKISGEIRRFLRDDGAIKISRSTKEKYIKIRRIADELQAKLERPPTLSEISKTSGFTIEEIAQTESTAQCIDSLNRPVNEDGQTLEEVLGNNGIEDNVLEYVSLSQAISSLTQKERIVIMLRFFKCMTQQQVAKIMKMSQVQISRIERSALKHLREKM